MKDQPFKSDIETIRKRAREAMHRGAVTAAYRGDLQRVISVLNEVLATEVVCTLRYKNHFYMARGIHGEIVAGELQQHAAEEQQHADRVAQRISQLGGVPNYNPEGLLTRSHSEYREGKTLPDMLKEDLVAERIAVESYSEIVRWLGDDDPTTRLMMEEILAKEEEHANDIASLLQQIENVR
jgi:bacterioferritin